MSTNPKLLEAWKEKAKKIAEARKLHAESCRLFAEGHKLYAEGNKLYAEGDKLRAEGYKLCAKGGELHAEAHLLWTNAIIEVYGKDMTMTWNYRKDIDGYDCILGNGEVYTVEMGNE